jgi:3-methyladenine DNA glycosylase AlkD
MPSAQDAQAAQQRLRSLADPAVAVSSARFFKTGSGEYGEGDIFIGIKSPTLKTVAKEFKALPLAEVECLLHSNIHEDRSLALVILVGQFTKADDATRKRMYDIYLANTCHINNWDLVDISAPQIVGGLRKRISQAIHSGTPRNGRNCCPFSQNSRPILHGANTSELATAATTGQQPRAC